MALRTRVHLGLGTSALFLLGCMTLLIIHGYNAPTPADEGRQTVQTPAPQNAEVNLITVTRR